MILEYGMIEVGICMIVSVLVFMMYFGYEYYGDPSEIIGDW